MHTPGPWVAEVTIGDSGGWKQSTQHVQIRAGETLVADFDTAFAEYPGDPECEANARLIAAAPDMLAALKDLCEGDRDDLNDSTSAIWQQAIEAIRKAEGRSVDTERVP